MTWKQSKLQEIFDVRDGTHESPQKTTEGVKLVTSKNIRFGQLDTESSYYISEEDAKQINKRSAVANNDILLSMIGTVGESCLVKENPDFVIKNVALIKHNTGVVLPLFSIKYLHSNKFGNILKSRNNGGIQKFIGLGDIRKLPITYPDLEEQQAIVDVLEVWDEGVVGLREKIALKRAVKRGLMQQLLTGRTRLPGFSGEWMTSSVSKLGHVFKGKGVSKKDLVESGLPVIRYAEIYTIYNIQILNINSFISVDTAKDSQEIQRGDIVFATSGETVEDIGKSAVYTLQEKCYVGGDSMILRPSKDSDPIFLAYRLNSFDIRRNFAKIAQGQSVVHLYPKNLDEVKINLPPLPEQQAIAAVLTAADEEIEALEGKLALIEEQRKYLLNELVTGKTRLPGFVD